VDEGFGQYFVQFYGSETGVSVCCGDSENGNVADGAQKQLFGWIIMLVKHAIMYLRYL
jgi:hypothetical protein